MPGAKAPGRAVAAGGDDLELALELRPGREVGEVTLGKVVDEEVAAARAVSAAPASTMSRSRPISSGPKVTGRCTPIFTPVQPLSLCEAVTIATAGTSSANCAK